MAPAVVPGSLAEPRLWAERHGRLQNDDRLDAMQIVPRSTDGDAQPLPPGALHQSLDVSLAAEELVLPVVGVEDEALEVAEVIVDEADHFPRQAPPFAGLRP